MGGRMEGQEAEFRGREVSHHHGTRRAPGRGSGRTQATREAAGLSDTSRGPGTGQPPASARAWLLNRGPPGVQQQIALEMPEMQIRESQLGLPESDTPGVGRARYSWAPQANPAHAKV